VTIFIIGASPAFNGSYCGETNISAKLIARQLDTRKNPPAKMKACPATDFDSVMFTV